MLPKLPNAKFAEIDPAPPICNLAVAFRESREYLDDLCKKVNVFDPVNTFDKDITEGKADYLLISILFSNCVYKYKKIDNNSYFYSPVKLLKGMADESFFVEYEEVPVTIKDVEIELSYLCEQLLGKTILIIQTATEVVFSNGKDKGYNNRVELNKVCEYLAKKYSNVRLVDIRKYAKLPSDFLGEVANHYNRAIGYFQANDILKIIIPRDESANMPKKSNAIPKNAIYGEKKSICGTTDVLKYTAYVRNGFLHVNMDISNQKNYDCRVQFWRGRYMEACVDMDESFCYKLALNKAGYWHFDIIISNKFSEETAYIKVGGFNYDAFRYLTYTDAEAEDYDSFISSANHLRDMDLRKYNSVQNMITQIANLAAVGCNVADYFIDNGISEISIFTNNEVGEILIPFLHNSKVKIKYIITADWRWAYFANGGKYRYNVYTIDDLKSKRIVLSSADTLLYAVKGDYEEYWRGVCGKLTSAKKVYLPYILNYLYTKTFFMDRFKTANSSKVMVVRSPDMISAYGFPYAYINSNERRAHLYLKNRNNALSKLDTEYENFPEQFAKLSKDELRETLSSPEFYDDNFSIRKMRDKSGEFLNIKNGFRVTLGQPEKYDGTIYVVGDSHVFGCGNKDSDTMASLLQKIVGSKYRVENRANLLSYDNISALGYFRNVNLMEYIPVKENDIIILILSKWRKIEDNPIGIWPIWEAIEEPIIKLDAFPIFEKQERPDYFLLPEAYTAEGNQAIAELIADKLKEIGYFNI